MAWNVPRIKLWWLMGAVAVVAVGLRFLDALVLGWPLVATAVLAVVAGRFRRRAAIAFCLAYPFLIPLALVLTWLTAWAVLGGGTYATLDDMKDIGLVAVLRDLTYRLMMGTPFVWEATLILAFWEAIGPSFWETERPKDYAARAALLTALAVVAWCVALFLMSTVLSPIVDWLMD